MVFHIQKYFSFLIVGMAFFVVVVYKTNQKKRQSPDLQSKYSVSHCKSYHGFFFVKGVFLEEMAKNVNFIY